MQTSRRFRWLVPAAALAGLVAVPQILGATADADPGLPELSAQELITKVVETDPVPMSGEVSQTTELGLPAVPQMGQGTDAAQNPLSLLSGTHQWRVWTNAKDSHRVALVDGTSENNLVVNPTDTWLYSSSTNEAVHYPTTDSRPANAPSAKTPGEIAEQVLSELDPSTEVTTGRNTTIAGRSAYALVLTPKDERTTIGQVVINVDGENFTVLRFQVWARGANSAAIDVAFTSISFEAPPASTFVFTPPAGVTVIEGEAPAKSASTKPMDKHTTVVGEGWTAVNVATLPEDATTSTEPNPMDQVLEQLPQVSGSWGTGRLWQGTLVSAVITDDGRIAFGAVAPELLYAALG